MMTSSVHVSCSAAETDSQANVVPLPVIRFYRVTLGPFLRALFRALLLLFASGATPQDCNHSNQFRAFVLRVS